MITFAAASTAIVAGTADGRNHRGRKAAVADAAAVAFAAAVALVPVGHGRTSLGADDIAADPVGDDRMDACQRDVDQTDADQKGVDRTGADLMDGDPMDESDGGRCCPSMSFRLGETAHCRGDRPASVDDGVVVAVVDAAVCGDAPWRSRNASTGDRTLPFRRWDSGWRSVRLGCGCGRRGDAG